MKSSRMLWMGSVVVVSLLSSSCDPGVVGELDGDQVAAENNNPTAQFQNELRKRWRQRQYALPDAGGLMPTADAGTPTPTPVVDAGTPTPTPTPVVDAGTPTPTPVVDAGTPAPTPTPVVDAGTPTPTPTPTPAVDAGTPTPTPTPVIDAGTPTPTPVVDAGTPTPDAGTVVNPGNPGTVDVTFAVDSTTGTRPISRYIYGKNFNGTTWAQEPNLTLNRIGGNRWTAYNWETNASCAGSDYNYQNDGFLGGGSTPGEAVRTHVVNARAAGGSILVTVPILGWVAADKLGTSTWGQAITSRFLPTVPAKGSAFQYPPNLTDGTVAQDEFVSWLETAFPTAHQDPNRELFYSLDNEPDLWADTHAEIHPAAVTYAELMKKSIDTSAAIKSVAPLGKIFGFVSYGYAGFVGLQGAPDAAGRDFTDVFLDGMRTASAARNTRLLDVLDLHWYPEARGGGVRIIGDDVSSAVAAARMQAPRSLWDPSYVETSWIASSNGNQPIKLISSMKAKIAAHYPGTGLAFTEYSYGGGAHISGGIAQADVLGIYGRDGVFAATFWPLSSSTSFITAAFAMFRSYDGAGGAFGDLSVNATNPDPANSSIYASVDASSPNRMVLVLINKAATARVAGVTVTHAARFTRSEVYQLTSSSPTIVRASDLTLPAANTVRYTMPAYSVTTLVLRP